MSEQYNLIKNGGKNMKNKKMNANENAADAANAVADAANAVANTRKNKNKETKADDEIVEDEQEKISVDYGEIEFNIKKSLFFESKKNPDP